MKDKYTGIIALVAICGFCIYFGVDYSKEVVLMTVPVIAAFVRD